MTLRTRFLEGGAAVLDRVHVGKLLGAALRLNQSVVVVGQGGHRLGRRRMRLLLRGGAERVGEVREVLIEGGLVVLVLALTRLQGLLGLPRGGTGRIRGVRAEDGRARPGGSGGRGGGSCRLASGGPGGGGGAAAHGGAGQQYQSEGEEGAVS